MSDAIRCGQCRWWNGRADEGTCELNPTVFIGFDPNCTTGWYQPRTHQAEGCSRGEPAQVETPYRGEQPLNAEKLDTLMRFVEQVRAEAHEDPELYGPFVRLVRDLDAKVGAK